MPTTATHRSKVKQSREEIRARMVAAARDLLRTRAYADLTVDDVMRAVGQGRTVFYRHFDDLPDLLARASIEAIEALYDAQVELSVPLPDDPAELIERSLTRAVEAYRLHGPLLRGISEAAAGDEQLAAAGDALRRQFDGLTERALRAAGAELADAAETARALTLMNERYLLDAFGRDPRVSPELAVRTLSEVWRAVFTSKADRR